MFVEIFLLIHFTIVPLTYIGTEFGSEKIKYISGFVVMCYVMYMIITFFCLMIFETYMKLFSNVCYDFSYLISS